MRLYVNIVPFKPQTPTQPQVVKPDPALFVAQLGAMRGSDCWGIIAGKGAGSVVSLEFGAKTAKKKPSRNRHLTDDERHYDAAHSLLIYSAWRLSNAQQVICSWRDDNDIGGPMLTGLAQMRHCIVSDIRCNPVTYDLAIYFHDGMVFEVFCDINDVEEADDNYLFFTPDAIYAVGLKSVLEREARQGV